MEDKIQLKILIGFDEKNNSRLLDQVSQSGMVTIGYDIIPSLVHSYIEGVGIEKREDIHYYECFVFFEDLVEGAKILMTKSRHSNMWRVFIPKLKSL